MNISPDGKTVRFKTEPKELFEVERSGAKPNTVRILNVYEANQIERESPTKIIIQNQKEAFLRTLTDIHFNYKVPGWIIAIFSWVNEQHHHTLSHEEQDPLAHTMSLDYSEQVRADTEEIRPHVHPMHTFGGEPYEDLPTSPILLPTALIADLMRNRRTKTLPEFIAELLIRYDTHHEKQVRDGFVEINISEQTLRQIQSIAHGRTLNMVIHELYERYLDAEESGKLHGQMRI